MACLGGISAVEDELVKVRMRALFGWGGRLLEVLLGKDRGRESNETTSLILQVFLRVGSENGFQN